jgi:hypothetical protein
VVGDSTISNNSSIAMPVPLAAVNASTKSAYKCADLQVAGGAPLFQKGVDQYGYPICEQDTTVNIMRDQICKQMMQSIWENGGTSTAPCEIITVTKVFPLSNFASKTTTDCRNISPAEARKLYKTENGTSFEVPDFNLNKVSGGTLSGAITNVTTFKTKYGITSTPPTFQCKKRTVVTKAEPLGATGWRSSTSTQFTLPSNYVPSSLNVTVIGGGSGGGGSNHNWTDPSGGAGGKAGNALLNNNLYLATVPGAVCKVTVGKGGGGGSPGSETKSSPGGDSAISCGDLGWNSGQAWVTGGTSVGLRAGGGDAGEGGANSPLLNSVGQSVGGGGTGAGCRMGGSGTQPGAGGGGGGTKDCAEQFSGGSGADGMAKVDSWKVYEWVDWTQ